MSITLEHPQLADPDTIETLGAPADARTAELHEARRLPPEVYRAAVAAGLFRQLVAADLGGLERTPLAWYRTGADLARHATPAAMAPRGSVDLLSSRA